MLKSGSVKKVRKNPNDSASFIALVIYQYLEKALGAAYTYDMILSKLKSMNFACIQG